MLEVSDIEFSRDNSVDKLVANTKKYIAPFLAEGKPNWEQLHSDAAEHWVRTLGEPLKLDMAVLRVAAVTHDAGYARLFKEADTGERSVILDRKKRHAPRGAGLARFGLFKQPEIGSYLTDEQKKAIIRLIKAHDFFDENHPFQNLDEQVLMEADRIAMIDLDRIKPTFKRESAKKFLESAKNETLPCFKTELGTKIFKEKLNLYEKYVKEMPSD